jgi:AmmeMemoRadiSam system protein A
LLEKDRQELLWLARASIAAHLAGLPAPEFPQTGAAAGLGGVFVSLHDAGALRGCIGHLEADLTIGFNVVRCAVSAATSDPRFPPVSPSELSRLHIELSLLGPMEPIARPDDFEIGRHGLMVQSGRRRGLLLPQVAIEWQWDRETFLAQTCRKAGLSGDFWKTGGTLWRFEAEVFGE